MSNLKIRKLILRGVTVTAILFLVFGLAVNHQEVTAQVPVEFPWDNRVVLAAMAAETPQDAVDIVVSEFLNWNEADKINLLEAGDLSKIQTSDTDWWLVATDWHTTDLSQVPALPVNNDYGYGVWLCQGKAIHQAPHQGVAIRLIKLKFQYIPMLYSVSN